MKSFSSNNLLDDLMADVRNIVLCANKLGHVGQATLEIQPAPGKWSVAQVLDHLNFYSRFYLQAIEEKLHGHHTKPKAHFTPGWFGNYFTRMMKPAANNEIKSKMKALKSATPPPSADAKTALDQFLIDQHTLLNLLQIARTADIGQLRVPTSLTGLITLKLGDTFRFFIAHEQRHFVQITNTLKAVLDNTAQSEMH